MVNILSYIKKILNNPFLTASLVMVIGSNVYNAGQLGFHIIAARILGTAHYGDVAALMNILGVFAIVQISLGLTVVKFVASGTDDKEVKNLVRWSLKVSLIMGIIMALIILAFSPFINRFLQLSQPTSIYILAPVILLYAITTITRSVLQGLLRFYIYVTSLIVEVGVKFVLMIIFVLSGFAVIGAMSALLVGVTCALLISIFALNKSFLRGETKTPEIKPLLVYVLPAFLQGLALTSMYSTDLFLVKHFFPPETAGIYAAVAKLGSIVYFAASPIANVMFPLVAKRHAHGENYHKIFYLSLLMVLAVSLGIIALYAFFPLTFLSILGSNFLGGAHILWWAGLFMGLLSISTLFIQFYMSIGKTSTVGLFILASVLQTVLIWTFHNSLLQVIQMSTISVALLTISLLVYFPYHDRKK